MTGKSMQRKGRRKIQKPQDCNEDGKENPTKEPENFSQESKKRQIQDTTTLNSLKEESKKRKIQDTTTLNSLRDANPTAAKDMISDKPMGEKTLEKENKCFDKKVGVQGTMEKTDEYKTQEETSVLLLEGQGQMMPDQVKTASEEDSPNPPVKHQQSHMDVTDNSEESFKEKQGNEDKDRNDIITGERPLVTSECDTALPTSEVMQHVIGSWPSKSPTDCNSLKLVESKEKTPYAQNSLDCLKAQQGAIDQPETELEVKSGVSANINRESTQSSLIGKENNENIHGFVAPNTFSQSVAKLAEGQIDTVKVKGLNETVKVTLEDKPEQTMVSPDLPVGGVTDVDDSKMEDITDSQLVAMDWMSQFAEESSSTASDNVNLEADKPDRLGSEHQIEDGSSIMAGFIRELSQLNKMLLKTKREMEVARRQRKTVASK